MSSLGDIVGGGAVERLSGEISNVSTTAMRQAVLEKGIRVLSARFTVDTGVPTNIEVYSGTTLIDIIRVCSNRCALYPYSPFGWWETEPGELLGFKSDQLGTRGTIVVSVKG
jgi:hypothetical protein